MKIQYKCLPCLVNQAIKVADMTNAPNKDLLLKKVFATLSGIDFEQTTPELVGEIFQLVKAQLDCNDPYLETRTYYNKLFLEQSKEILKKIDASTSPFETSIKYAIIGNIIDFNPIHNHTTEQIMEWFDKADELSLTISHTQKMLSDIKQAKTLLYLGDNCGEICLDRLLIEKIKALNPELHIYFGVRGEPVVNDCIEDDAYFVGLDQYATIINNGDYSLGTVLPRTSDAFKAVYNSANMIISKGQANYESLSEALDKNIYFLLMTKCDLIADDIGVPAKSLICLNNQLGTSNV